MKYNYYEDLKNRTVICTTHFDGKVIKGKAKCAPEDEYSFYVGAKIAKARVDLKLARKKSILATQKMAQAMVAAQAAEDRRVAAVQKASVAIQEVMNCINEVRNLTRS